MPRVVTDDFDYELELWDLGNCKWKALFFLIINHIFKNKLDGLLEKLVLFLTNEKYDYTSYFIQFITLEDD